MIGDRVIRPGEHVLRDRGAAGQFEPGGRGRVLEAGGVSRHPRKQHRVAFVHMGDGVALLEHDAGGFVAEQYRPPARAMHLVQLRVADAGGELPHNHLRWRRIGQVDVVNFQWSFAARQNDHARGCAHLWFLCIPVIVTRRWRVSPCDMLHIAICQPISNLSALNPPVAKAATTLSASSGQRAMIDPPPPPPVSFAPTAPWVRAM